MKKKMKKKMKVKMTEVVEEGVRMDISMEEWEKDMVNIDFDDLTSLQVEVFNCLEDKTKPDKIAI